MNNHLIPNEEFLALINDAKTDNANKEKLWFLITDRILAAWRSTTVSDIWKLESRWREFLNALPPGQYALVTSASFYRSAKEDFFTSLGEPEKAARALKAFKIIEAREYFDLLRQIEAVFPGRKFPEFAEDMVAALLKQPDGYFDKAAEKFVTGKTMQRPLYDYIFDYVMTHPEEFRTA